MEDEFEPQIREPAAPDLLRRQTAIVLAVGVAGILLIGGVILGRETASSTTRTVTVAAAPKAQEPPAANNTTTPGVGTNSASTGAPTPAPIVVPTDATLQAGAKGASVIALQKALISLGYLAGATDGAYGAATARAVASFQTAKGLTADGVAGAKTLATINADQTSG